MELDPEARFPDGDQDRANISDDLVCRECEIAHGSSHRLVGRRRSVGSVITVPNLSPIPLTALRENSVIRYRLHFCMVAGEAWWRVRVCVAPVAARGRWCGSAVSSQALANC